MKKRFSEEQIIGFLREAEAGLPIKELCRKHPQGEYARRLVAVSNLRLPVHHSVDGQFMERGGDHIDVRFG